MTQPSHEPAQARSPTFSSPEFRAALGMFATGVTVVTARGPDGAWWVVGQRTQAPSGLGYVMQNRLIVCAAGGAEILEGAAGMAIGKRNRTILRKILWKVGVQLAAAPAREDLLLQLGTQLEQAMPWAGRRPPLHAAND